MTDETLVARVTAALEGIPHGPRCPAQPREYPVDVAETVTLTVTMGTCGCDREQRIAQRVAAAIELGIANAGGVAITTGCTAALRALERP